MKKVVVIGGGNGSSTVISALKNDFDVTAVISMADNGGSTGRLRKELGVSAGGDIRQCLVAFAESEDSKKLFSYRFTEGGLEGHSLGNLFLSTIEDSTHDIHKAIDRAKNILEIKRGDVIPVTDDKPELVMDYEGTIVKGVYEIANTKINGKKAKFYLDPPTARISSRAEEAILQADLILIAPGNFYCSILPALIVDGLAEALQNSNAKKVFICNLVNFSNHTQGFTTEDYLLEVARINKTNFIDILIANDNMDLKTEDEPVQIIKSNQHVIADNLISPEINKPDPNDKIARLRSKVNHNKTALNKIITQILRSK